MKSDIVNIALVVLVVANIWGFIIFRINVSRSVECAQYQGPRPGKAINYLLAGNVAQPEQAFDFLLGDLEGEVVFCNYRQNGWSVTESTNRIFRDILVRVPWMYHDGFGMIRNSKEKFLVRVYAVSCADIVARHLDDASKFLPPSINLEIIAINPASSPQLLKPYMKWGLKIVTPIMKTFCYAIGFLSCIPCIPSTGSWHSLILLTDQWMELAYSDAPHVTDSTVGAILSTQDAFLVNENVREYFSGVRLFEIDAGHADVQHHAVEFAGACQRAIEASNRQQTAEKVERTEKVTQPNERH